MKSYFQLPKFARDICAVNGNSLIIDRLAQKRFSRFKEKLELTDFPRSVRREFCDYQLHEIKLVAVVCFSRSHTLCLWILPIE